MKNPFKKKKKDEEYTFECYFCHQDLSKSDHSLWCVRHPNNKPKKD